MPSWEGLWVVRDRLTQARGFNRCCPPIEIVIISELAKSYTRTRRSLTTGKAPLMHFAWIAIFAGVSAIPLPAQAQTELHGWLNNETLRTRYGDFEFKNGYPAGETGARLLETQKLNRAVEVYTTQMMRVSEIAAREGMRAFGAKTPQQVVIWENLMDAKTVLLTA